MSILYGADSELCEWVSNGLGGRPDLFNGTTRALGVVRDTKLLAAVVYHNYYLRPDNSPLSIEMSIYSVDKRWATRHNLKALYSYPFIQLGLERVQTTCSADNEGVIMFNQRLGFKPEGYHRQAWPLGGDAISWSMLKPECRWI